MPIASTASEITLPPINQGWDNILDFLDFRFPSIGRDVWRERITQGKVHWYNGETVSLASKFRPSKRLCYYREVSKEPKIPFSHHTIYQNEHLLVLCKPHFLPVTPGGQYVNECLLERAKAQTGIKNLSPLHRLDKDTAGLVIFSTNPETRSQYHELFATRKIVKQYFAVALLDDKLGTLKPLKRWMIRNRLIESKTSFVMTEVCGAVNAESSIELIKREDNLGLFKLLPKTGKKHQLRKHMAGIGAPILNDPFYPKLLPKSEIQFDRPLQLLAQSLRFIDPISKTEKYFKSKRSLSITQ